MHRILSILLIVLLFAEVSFANPPSNVYAIDSIYTETEYLDMGPFTQVFEEDKVYTFDEIQAKNISDRFVPLKGMQEKFVHDKTYWGKIRLQNKVSMDMTWGFSVGGNYTEYWIVRANGKVEHAKGGWLRPESELKDKEKRFWCQVFLEEGEEATIYYKAYNITHYPVRMMPFLMTQEAYFGWRYQNAWVQGVFQGILWIMILYNLLNFISSRDRSYLYYILYLVSISFYFLYLYGILRKQVLGEIPRSQTFIWILSIYSSTLFYVLFTRRYFDTKKRVPFGDWLLVNWVRAELVILVGLIGILAITYDIKLVRSINTVVMLGGAILAGAILWQLRVLKSRIYYLYLIGASSYLASVIIFFYGSVFAEWGWIERVSYNLSYIVEVGVVFEILCFSIGLGYRMKMSEKAKRNAQEKLIEQLEENRKLQEDTTRELERKVRLRTKEIENQKEEIETQKESLEFKNHELRDLNEEKNHLMGVLAHDLRNPLTSLLTITNLLKSEQEDLHQDHVEYVDAMLGALDRMQNMISRTLDIKATEAGDLKMEWAPVKLDDVVSNVVEDFRGRAAEKDIQVEVSTVGLQAKLDESYTEQVLENLISNAIKFTPPGKQVWVEMENNNGKVKVVIKDEGPGLLEEDQEKLFGKYQRLSAKPTGGESSTGLGLSIVKKYVEAMNGRVWCESEYGKGATFIVEFKVWEEVA